MHIKIQKFWLWIGFGVLLLLDVFAGIGLYYAKHGINDSDYWLNHSAVVNGAIGETRASYDAADMSGRLATVGVNGERLGDNRNDVKGKIDALRALVSDNPNQMENVRSLEAAISERFSAQDKSIENVKFVQNGETKLLTMPVEQSLRSNEAAGKIAAAFHSLRDSENKLLFERTKSNTESRKSNWTGHVIVLSINGIAVIVFATVGLKNNSVLQYMAKEIRAVEKNGASGDKLKELREFAEGV